MSGLQGISTIQPQGRLESIKGGLSPRGREALDELIKRKGPAAVELMLSILPGSGEVISAQESAEFATQAYEDIGKGRVGSGLIGLGESFIAAAGALPVVGGTMRALRNLGKIASINKKTLKTALKKALKSTYADEALGVRIITDPTKVARPETVRRLGLEKPPKYKIGDEIKEKSYVWNEEFPTDERRSGVSTLLLNRDGSNLEEIAELMMNYQDEGVQAVIVSGKEAGTGFDIGEAIIEQPVVRAVLD